MQARESDSDPLNIMAGLVPKLRDAIDGLDETRLRQPEKPGKWSVLEVIQHLADSELVYGYRIRRILTEDAPAIEGFDQDEWARTLRYRDMNVDGVLDQLRAVRAANLLLYRTLDDTQLDRFGVHSERGRESIRDILQSLAEHDLQHVRQIERIKKGFAAE